MGVISLQLWQLLLVLVPVNAAISFASASISFTAWNLIVPLLGSIFGIPLRVCVLLSVVTDIVNALVLLVLNVRQQLVDGKVGMLLSLVGFAVTATWAHCAPHFLEQNVGVVGQTLYILPLIMATGFLIRAVVASVQASRARRAKIQETVAPELDTVLPPPPPPPSAKPMEDLEMQALATVAEGKLLPPVATGPGPESDLSDYSPSFGSDSDITSVGSPDSLHGPLSIGGSDDLLYPAGGQVVWPAARAINPRPGPAAGARPGARPGRPAAPEAPPAPGVSLSWWDKLLLPHAPLIRWYGLAKTSRIPLRLALVVANVSIMSSLSGLLFFGGGMVMAVAQGIFLRADIRSCAATSSMITLFVMLGALSALLRDPTGEIYTFDLGMMVIVSGVCSTLFTLLGHLCMRRLRQQDLYYVISAILFAIGIGILVQQLLQ
ncbi:hypothetical protein H696_06271 [Fonticula alba]|uniref:Uncharacterized protein n=1 Tax=Fonticula alba TaxID=691883 RepID=A0A058YZK7_FONAL|nr:hypothetical protein H696_06271 [Fonticula alba]KCV67306.1 hypothetical protein H696_06271 [Fonticula alba]|eukprot:XP_009498288.1 hypothetical protein H696_06271 [Fonticula alba]